MQDSVEKTLGGGRGGTLEQQVGSPGRDWPHVAGRGNLHQGDLGKGCSLSHLKLVLASEFLPMKNWWHCIAYRTLHSPEPAVGLLTSHWYKILTFFFFLNFPNL